VVLAIQVGMMVRFLGDPIGRALWLSAFGVTVYVTGMMISAFAVRGMTA
jgi:chlorophyll synthase